MMPAFLFTTLQKTKTKTKQNKTKQAIEQKTKKQNPKTMNYNTTDTIASEVISASLGGAFSSAVLYPLEVLKTKMQADGSHKHNNNGDDDYSNDKKENEENSRTTRRNSNNNMIQYSIDLYKQNGYKIFLQGVEVSATLSAIEKACYFCSYTMLKKLYYYYYATTTTTTTATTTSITATKPQKNNIPVITNLVLGYVAEWCHLPITLPIDAITTSIQTSSGGTADVLGIWMMLWKERSFYRGVQAYYILCFKPALQYSIYEQIKSVLVTTRRGKSRKGARGNNGSEQQLSAGEAFLLGMFSRAIATLIVFPFVRAKVLLQKQSTTKEEEGQTSSTTTAKNIGQTSSSSSSSSGITSICPTVDKKPDHKNEGKNKNTNIWEMLLQTYTNDGLPGLYRGLGPELTRGVLSAALMMTVKERINVGVKRTLYGSNNHHGRQDQNQSSSSSSQ
jgi:hypothetical protein